MQKTSLFKTLLKSYFSYLKGKNKCNYFPFKIWIETTSRCNLACRLCLNREINNSDKGDMDFSLFKKIINQSKDFLYEANLFHRGEPLLNPNIAEMIEYASINNIKTCIHTNATLLNEEMSIKILKSGLTKIYFSLDTFIKEDYEYIRSGADFEKTVSNIKNFLQLKKELKLNRYSSNESLLNLN